MWNRLTPIRRATSLIENMITSLPYRGRSSRFLLRFGKKIMARSHDVRFFDVEPVEAAYQPVPQHPNRRGYLADVRPAAAPPRFVFRRALILSMKRTGGVSPSCWYYPEFVELH